MNTPKTIRTVPVRGIEPIFVWENAFRKVHICTQLMGHLYVTLCGSNTDDVQIPENPDAIAQNTICKKCHNQCQVSLDDVALNTWELLEKQNPDLPKLTVATKHNLKIVNLTGHPITILDHMGDKLFSVMGDGRKAAVKPHYITNRNVTELGDIPYKDLRLVVDIEHPGKGFEDFPEPQVGVIYVVPSAQLIHLQKFGRTDCYCPGPLLRDKDRGGVLGCVGLARYVEA